VARLPLPRGAGICAANIPILASAATRCVELLQRLQHELHNERVQVLHRLAQRGGESVAAAAARCGD
jgi:hypothetical protein